MFNDETIKEQADTAKDGAHSITLLGTIGPIVAAILGLILIGLGLALAVSNSRREDHDASLPNPRSGSDASQAPVQSG